MKLLNYSLGLLIVLVASFSCENDDISSENYAYNALKISECNEKTEWTEASVAAKIKGTWEWKASHISFSPDPGFDFSVWKGLQVTFNSDYSGVAVHNGTSTDFTWEIDTNADTFTFTTTPDIFQLDGWIYLCDNVMLCSNAPVDGADNYFEKK